MFQLPKMIRTYKNNENDSEWCIICHIFPGLPECSKSPKIWVKIGDKTSDTTRLSDYLHPNPRHDFWGHCLSCLSRLSPMLAKSNGDVTRLMIFSALMTCLKVNVGNVRNTNVRERITRTCLLQTPTMQYFQYFSCCFMKGPCWDNLSSALPVMYAASCSPSQKIFPSLFAEPCVFSLCKYIIAC